MKTMFLAAAAVMVLGVGSAYAGDGGGGAPNTFFTELPGVIAHAPAQDNRTFATNQNRSSASAYAAPQYPWLPRG